ncbi:hypothetical protein Bbelb_328890 [Branchiostoma belcheri]|nr:hypothetical protein Bbelb_328890 [Branchiostoma belcheri]
MKFLSQLDLSYNQLSAVRLGVYMVSSYGLRTITSVTVAYNNLATFSETDLGIIPNNMQIISRHLQGNPLHCDCRMSWLSKLVAIYYEKCRSYLSWLSCPLRRGPFYDSLRASDDFKCSSPTSLKDTPLRTVNLPVCQATTPTNVFLPFTTETTTTAKITILSATTTNKFATTTAKVTTFSATTKNKFTTTRAPNATKPSMTMPMIRQVGFFVNATTPKFTISSVNASEKDKHITRPIPTTNKAHAPKESTAIPTAALVAIAVVAVLLLALAIAVVIKKLVQKHRNPHDGQDGKEQEVELSETKAGSNANP